MGTAFRRRPTTSLVVSIAALVVAMSGTAVAAGALSSGDALIKKHSLSGNRLVNHTLTGKQINLNKLGKVPSAKNADHATVADSATTATSATSATSATNASELGGQPPSAFLPSSAAQRSGIVTVSQGTGGKQILSSGPLSVTLSCTVSGGVTTATLDAVSTVSNWLFYGSTEPSGIPQQIDTVDDSGSPGSEKGTSDTVDFVAPGGQALDGAVSFGVNWPGVDECFADGFAAN